MYFKKYFLLLISIAFIVNSYAQSSSTKGKLTAKIFDEKKNELGGVTVLLLSAKDSGVAKFGVTDAGGSVVMEEIKSGNYFLKLTYTGFETFFSKTFLIDDSNALIELKEIVMTQSAKQLNEVTVIAQKPFIEKKLDKTVINVDNSVVSAGSSAMEVLERSPGIVIDRNDNISLKGKQGVIIMINGKPSGVAGSDLANYLRGLPANAIEKIEIITNPSAKYDAAGNAGIINIIMKKDQRMGFNGTATLSYGQGLYPKVVAGLTFNYRNNKLNSFGNYNFNYREAYNDLKLYRKFYDGDHLLGVYDQSNYIKFDVKTHVPRIGFDYNLSKNTIVGAVVSGIYNTLSSNSNTITNVLDSSEQKQSYNTNNSITNDTLRHYAVNVNLKHTFDTTGKELTVDLDYAQFRIKDSQHFITDFFQLNGDVQQPSQILSGTSPGKLDIKSIKADYVNPLKGGAKIEAGIKSSIVSADNDLKYFDVSSGTPVYDSTQSNHFVYDENINAAYLNFNKEYKKLSMQIGLRAEQTRAKGNQITTGQKFDTSYIKLFPSVFLNYNASDKNSFSVSFSRRIDRPSYRQLNPFKFFINNSTYKEGNPYLLPQFTYSFELSHTYKQKITTTLSYSITKDNITEMLVPSTTEEKVTVQTDRNITSFEYFGTSVSAPVQITKWWNSTNSLNTYYGLYKGDVANTYLNNGSITFNFNSTNSFIIGKKGLSGELTGFYQAKEVYGYFTVFPYWQLSAGLQKSILQKKATLKLNFTDIFHTTNGSGISVFNDYNEHFKVARDTRVVTLAFVYRF